MYNRLNMIKINSSTTLLVLFSSPFLPLLASSVAPSLLLSSAFSFVQFFFFFRGSRIAVRKLLQFCLCNRTEKLLGLRQKNFLLKVQKELSGRHKQFIADKGIGKVKEYWIHSDRINQLFTCR